MWEVVAAMMMAPQAWVFDHTDAWTQSAHAESRLRAAGFAVSRLSAGDDIGKLPPGLIVFGSFSSEAPGADRVAKHPGLTDWIRRGGVLLQLTQADQNEAEPPFLPSGLRATRDDADFPSLHLSKASHPLVAGLGAGPFAFHPARTSWETFRSQRGFEVLASADWEGSRPALMTSTLGRGAIVLTSLALDKEITPKEGVTEAHERAFAAFQEGFFRNLREWVATANATGLPASIASMSAEDVAPVTPGSWSLALLPDTQVYAQSFPGVFSAQTAFLRNHAARLNLRYVLHLGDITNWNTPEQWRNAYDSMRLLHGHVSYALAPGNHDYGPRGNAGTRETYLNEFFPYSEHIAQPGFGGAFEPGKIDNTYHLFEAGGRKWIVIALEWGPRDEAVAWADSVMAKHPDRTGILITHAYMFSDETRYDWAKFGAKQTWNPHSYATPGSKNDGEQLWQKLVRKHRFAMTLNGHVLNDGAAHLVSPDDSGRNVHQILANYQMRQLGGEGYLRILEFQPDGKRVRIKAYSPVYDRYILRPDHTFEIEID